MREVAGIVVGVVLLLAAIWLAPRGESPPAIAVARERPAAAERGEVERPASSPAAAPRRADKAASRAEREALRRKIVEALAARERAPGDVAEESGQVGAAARGRAARAPSTDAPPQPGALVDRGGNHGYLLKVMNEDLMPLADECYALARADQPALAGMLVLDVEVLGDPELGGVVEAVAPGTGNEVADPALLECMRESILATTLPPPPQGGRDAFSLSMPLSPEAAK